VSHCVRLPGSVPTRSIAPDVYQVITFGTPTINCGHLRLGDSGLETGTIRLHSNTVVNESCSSPSRSDRRHLIECKSSRLLSQRICFYVICRQSLPARRSNVDSNVINRLDNLLVLLFSFRGVLMTPKLWTCEPSLRRRCFAPCKSVL